MPKRLTLDEFIVRATDKHQGFYSYELVEYSGTDGLVTITCPTHGNFEMKAGGHLCGYRCHQCAKLSHLEKMQQTNIIRYGSAFPLQNADSKSKMIQTNLDRYGVTNVSQAPSSKEKTRRTWMAKYGVNHPFDRPGIRTSNVQKTKDTKLKTGSIIDPDAKLSWKQYWRKVRSLTRTEYKNHKSKINPGDLPLTEFHIDHMFSIFDGFANKVNPKILASHCNLQVISKLANSQKKHRSSITLDDLLKRHNDL